MNRQQVVLSNRDFLGNWPGNTEVLAINGFRVFGTLRRDAEARTLAGVETLLLDVRDEASVRPGVETVLNRAGRIDALVNNAGYALIGSLEETGIEEAKQLFETNFFGALRMTAAVLPFFREQRRGRIVNIGSVVGLVPAPYQGIYAASKHVLEGYSESLDHEVRQFGIRVSVIEPGFTKTRIAENMQTVTHPLDANEQMRNRVLEAVARNIEGGTDSRAVASVVLQALTSASPRLRYPVGREAKTVSRLRRFVPYGLFDRGLRKQ